ncbi:MAG: DUF3309 family protein [Pseudomonadota bacterium]
MDILKVITVPFLLLLVAGLPRWSHSKDWGYGPCGGLAVIGVLLMFDWLR